MNQKADWSQLDTTKLDRWASLEYPAKKVILEPGDMKWRSFGV